jgi:Phasin protein
MARNRQDEMRQAADENLKAAGEMGTNILTLSVRAAEQSINGFSRMLGLGQNTGDAIEQSRRGIEVVQAWTRLLGIGYQDMSKEYLNWARNQMQTNVTSVARFMQCRTPDQLLACYNQLLGENIALALTLNGRLAEISKQVVDRTAETIIDVAEQKQEAEKQAA